MSAPQRGVSFPCFTLMNTACTGSVAMPRSDSGQTMPVFTSEASLKKFRAAAPTRFGPTVKFDGPREFLDYLEALPPTPTHIGLDPEKPGSVVSTFPVAEMKEDLRKWLKDNP